MAQSRSGTESAGKGIRSRLPLAAKADPASGMAALLRAKPRRPGAHGPRTAQLQTVLTELTSAGSDLPATLDRLAGLLAGSGREELLDEMRDLEQRDREAFLAGFALGRASAPLKGGRPRRTIGEAGVVSGPISSAQTGPGGLGYLETPVPDDDRR